MRRFMLAAILGCAPPGAVAAQSSAQLWEWCRDHDPSLLIRGCSAIIRAGQEAPDALARAYFNRGRGWFEQADYDRAIRDFDTAIRLDAEYPEAYNNRALAYSGKNQPDLALQDFDRAVQIDPNYAIALYNRGLLLRSLGREAEAVQSFASARQAGPRLTPSKE
jgi:tetratricopeptide (TPR) repeat protein